ncbi:hypothetical protein [Methanobrevibacter arboriphilus]|uniref:Uncharacterized protein n=1 Tax=Methanobrevibacter arboriphilus TaxID=39441 RepID=A0ACA8R2J7_METAZ|nr:hypothetical protein [Methanobrevibacter arboriphilus]BBL61544.1 hypothetical protein MarbSA_05840 [Methanobrevibacter arboriphilus]
MSKHEFYSINKRQKHIKSANKTIGFGHKSHLPLSYYLEAGVSNGHHEAVDMSNAFLFWQVIDNQLSKLLNFRGVRT